MELKKIEEVDESTPVVNLSFTYIHEPFIKEFPRYFKNDLFQAVWKEHIQLHKGDKLVSDENVDDSQNDSSSFHEDITNDQDEEAIEPKIVLEIKYIKSRLWEPVISRCKSLITEIQECSIRLSVVIKYFGNYEEKNSFIQLANPLDEKIDTFSAEKFAAKVECILSYKSFLNCKDVANAFLNIRKMLKLTGNFQSFESIANPVSYNTTQC